MPAATPAVSVIVPTYKEAGNLPLLVPRICRALAEAQLPLEIIVVDDHSQDGTEEAVARLQEQGLPVTIDVRALQCDLSSAVIHGFRRAKGRFLVCMDADLSHPPEQIPELVAALQSHRADFVIGSRYLPGATMDAHRGLFRRLRSKVVTLMARPLAHVRDPMSGFFALSRELFLRADEFSPVGSRIALELLVKTRCSNVVEIPVHSADRTVGSNRLNLSEWLKYVRHLKRLFDYKYAVRARFLQFCLVGATGVGVDLLSLNCLLLLTDNFRLSRAIAIGIAMTWNFYLNRRFTFSHARREPWFGQYLKFVGTCLVGALVSWCVSIMMVGWRPESVIWIQVAALVGIVCGTVSNFLFAYHFVFPARAADTASRRTDRN